MPQEVSPGRDVGTQQRVLMSFMSIGQRMYVKGFRAKRYKPCF